MLSFMNGKKYIVHFFIYLEIRMQHINNKKNINPQIFPKYQILQLKNVLGTY